MNNVAGAVPLTYADYFRPDDGNPEPERRFDLLLERVRKNIQSAIPATVSRERYRYVS
jgi:hypothetical protein